ncbi:MAG TPA: SDR family oxidoreductase [Acidimicrobiia bacterium]|nr:SDR family oxidoreductase [Acidimicrobiia bacterium]
MNILITGGTSGVGRCVVECLTKEGHAVAFVGRNEDRGREVAQSTGATFIAADITSATECERVTEVFFAHFDQCDVLINNAGLWTQGNLIDAPVKEIEDVLAINTLSPIILTKYFLEHIEKAVDSKAQGSARIIFVNSLAGLNAKAQRSVYFASKWAITGFARSLSIELGPKNIAVTNVCPGYINTELFEHGGYPRDASDAMDPHAVADAIAYILSLPSEVQIGEITIKPTKYN